MGNSKKRAIVLVFFLCVFYSSYEQDDTTQEDILYAAYKDEIVALKMTKFGSSQSPSSITTRDMKDVNSLARLPQSGDLIFTSFQAVESDAVKFPMFRLSNFSMATEAATSSVMMEDAGLVDCLAVDETSQLVYWVDRQMNTIKVASLDGQHKSQLSSKEITKPHAIALDVDHSILYISDLSTPAGIKVCHQDGLHCFTLVSSDHVPGLVRPNALVSLRDDLYWTDSGSGHVSSVNTRSLRVTRYATERHMPHSLAVSKSAVYWTELHQQGVFYVSLSAHDDQMVVALGEPNRIRTGRLGVASLAIASTSLDGSSTDTETNKCSQNNGGCDHLCIPCLLEITCLCGEGFVLQPDKTSCHKKEEGDCPDFRCADGSGCVPNHEICDVTWDCEDGSDEKDCPAGQEVSKAYPPCTAEEYRCASGKCIHFQFMCDKHRDCEDGADEVEKICLEVKKGFTCPPQEWKCADGFQCIHIYYRCDSDDDCYDNSDEDGCTDADGQAITFNCTGGKFYCAGSKRCVSGYWRCDGEVDCEDGEDEQDCPAVKCPSLHFTCPDGTCVKEHEHCSRSDVLRSTPHPEITQCPDGEFQCADGQCIATSLVCDTFSDCRDDSDEWGCPTSTNPEEERSCAGKFRCGSDECIEQGLACDVIPHCLDGSDETNCKVTCENFKSCSHMCEETIQGPRCVCYSGYKLSPQNICEDIDECQERNGGCSQVCENRRGGFRCKCLDGFSIDRDNRRCKASGPRPTVYVGTKEGISHFELHGADLPLDIPDKAEVLNTVSLASNAHTGDVYWLAHTRPGAQTNSVKSSVVYRTKPSPSSSSSSLTSTVPVLTADAHARDIALDWITGNLYIIIEKLSMSKTEKSLVAQLSLKVLCHGNDHLRSLVIENYLPRGTTSQGLVLHPTKRLVFYIAGSQLLSRWMDGTNRGRIAHDLGHAPSGLSIDIPTERLYWVTNSDDVGGALMVSNLDGSNKYEIRKTNFPVPYMDVFEGLAYAVNPTTHCLTTLQLYDNPDVSPRREHTRHALDQEHAMMTPALEQKRRRASFLERVGFGCNGLVDLRDVQHAGPLRVVHELKQPLAGNPCSNMSCMFMCVSTPEEGRCLCDDGNRFITGNPDCSGPKESPHLHEPIKANVPQAADEPSTTYKPSTSTSFHQKEITTSTSNEIRTSSTTPSSKKLTILPPATKTTSASTAIPVSMSSTAATPSSTLFISSATATTTTKSTSSSSSNRTSVDSCDLCEGGEVCFNMTGKLVCRCKHGKPCHKGVENKEGATRSKGRKSMALIAAIVIPVFGTMIFIVVGVGCYRSKRKRDQAKMMTTISFKNPNFSVRHDEKDDLVPRVSFAGTFFKHDLVDELEDEADCTVDENWWRRLLARSRISLETTANLPKPTSHIRTISTVEEVDELEEEEVGEEGEGTRVREVGRRPSWDTTPGFRSDVGTGRDPQCLNTCDKSRLLI